MKTALPIGTAFVVKHAGECELHRVTEWEGADPDERGLTGAGRVMDGEVVHKCVWKKGDVLESRGTYTVQPGEVSHIEKVAYLWNQRHTYWVNDFANSVPVWLRTAR